MFRRCVSLLSNVLVRRNRTRLNVKTSNTSEMSKLFYPTHWRCKRDDNSPPLYESLLGFSLFTWLGFDDKTIVEDDIVTNIKRTILLINSEEYEKAEQMLHITLRLAQQTMNHPAILYIYDLMANLALERGQLGKARKLFVEVMQRLLQKGYPENDIKNIHVSLKLAYICYMQGENDNAETGFKWCMEQFEKIPQSDRTDDTKKLIALAYNWYGHTMVEKNDFKAASDLLMESYSIMKDYEEEMREQVILLLSDIGTAFDAMEDYDTAERYLSLAANMSKSCPDMKNLSVVYINLGRVYIKKQMYENARKRCGYGLKLSHSEKSQQSKAEALACLKEVRALS